jgi:hypothetical protein
MGNRACLDYKVKKDKHSAVSKKPLKRLKKASGETSGTGLNSGANGR